MLCLDLLHCISVVGRIFVLEVLYNLWIEDMNVIKCEVDFLY